MTSGTSYTIEIALSGDTAAAAGNQKPRFNASGYSFSVRENYPTTAFGTVTADDGENDPVTYSIVGGNASGLFSIDSSNGRLTAVPNLDHERASAHDLVVQATQTSDSEKYDASLVNVSVGDVNEAPAFDLDSYEFAVPVEANLPAGAVDRLVGAVRASDHDTDDIVSYNITGGNSSGYFTVDGLGRIYANRASRLSARESSLTLTATDSAGLTDTTTATVKVTSQPIARLVVDYDHFTTGRAVGASIEFENGSGIATSAFTLTITSSATQAGGAQGSSGARSATPSTSYTFGSTQVSARTIVGGRAYDFSIPNYTTATSLPIPTSALPSDLSTGRSHLTLTRRTTSSSEFAISNGKIPIVVEPSSLAVGETYQGEWGLLPSIASRSQPNERRFSLSISTSTRTRIDLTSGGRDPLLVLEDSSGNVLEWNDDGGADRNAKIVRELDSGSYTSSHSPAGTVDRECTRSR